MTFGEVRRDFEGGLRDSRRTVSGRMPETTGWKPVPPKPAIPPRFEPRCFGQDARNNRLEAGSTQATTRPRFGPHGFCPDCARKSSLPGRETSQFARFVGMKYAGGLPRRKGPPIWFAPERFQFIFDDLQALIK
jgi:hypothetical protein